MVLARVAGTVVSTAKAQQLNDLKLLMVEKVSVPELTGTGEYLVALDAVGAAEGELVFAVTGSSARMTDVSKGRPTDATVTAIVDRIDLGEVCVYRKSRGDDEA